MLVLDDVTTSGAISIATSGSTLRANHVSGSTVALSTTGTGSLQVDDIVATGAVTLDSAKNVLEVGTDAGADVVAGGNSVIKAVAVLGTLSDALEVQITSATLSVQAGGSVSGVSINLGGTINPAPGSTKFNNLSF